MDHPGRREFGRGRDRGDIVVRPENGEAARLELKAAGYRYEAELSSIGGSSWTTPDGVNLDVVEIEAPWLRGALEEAQHNRDAQGLPVLPLVFLVIMKFESGRVQDLAGVTRMLGQADAAMLEAIRQVFTRDLPQILSNEIDDLESLIILGQMEENPP